MANKKTILNSLILNGGPGSGNHAPGQGQGVGKPGNGGSHSSSSSSNKSKSSKSSSSEEKLQSLKTSLVSAIKKVDSQTPDGLFDSNSNEDDIAEFDAYSDLSYALEDSMDIIYGNTNKFSGLHQADIDDCVDSIEYAAKKFKKYVGDSDILESSENVVKMLKDLKEDLE